MTLVNCHQSWIYLSIPSPQAPPSLILDPINGYQSFQHAVVLDQVMRLSGQDQSQVLFREILLRLQNGEVTEADWTHLMSRTPAHITDISDFTNALHLFPTVEAVVEHNVMRLHACGQPVATIKAVHSGVNAPLMMLVDWSQWFV